MQPNISSFDFRQALSIAENSRRFAVVGVIGLLILLTVLFILFIRKFGIHEFQTPILISIELLVLLLGGIFGFYLPYKKIFVNTVIEGWIRSKNKDLLYSRDQFLSKFELANTHFFVASIKECNTEFCTQFKTDKYNVKCFEIESSGSKACNPCMTTYTTPSGKRGRAIATSEVDELIDGLLAVNEIHEKFNCLPNFQMVIVPQSETYSIDNDVLEIALDESKENACFTLKRKSWPSNYSRPHKTYISIDSKDADMLSKNINIERTSQQKFTIFNSRFTEVFKTFSNNTELAKSVLDTTFCNELLVLRQKMETDIIVSFVDDKLFIGAQLGYGNKIFEPPFLKPIDETIERNLVNELNKVTTIISSSCRLGDLLKEKLRKN